jgi:hypothetical protein
MFGSADKRATHSMPTAADLGKLANQIRLIEIKMIVLDRQSENDADDQIGQNQWEALLAWAALSGKNFWAVSDAVRYASLRIEGLSGAGATHA